jgi:hypothetical protein
MACIVFIVLLLVRVYGKYRAFKMEKQIIAIISYCGTWPLASVSCFSAVFIVSNANNRQSAVLFAAARLSICRKTSESSEMQLLMHVLLFTMRRETIE